MLHARMLCARTLLVLSLWVAAGAQAPPPEAQDLLARIGRNGAASVVKELTAANESQWHRVIHKIDTGSPAWLEVASKLLPATDAGGTEDLRISLAIALTRNPNGVLAMLGPNLSIEQVCTVPFIEPDEKTVRAHKLKVRAALRKVTSETLAAKKQDCLKSIAQ